MASRLTRDGNRTRKHRTRGRRWMSRYRNDQLRYRFLKRSSHLGQRAPRFLLATGIPFCRSQRLSNRSSRSSRVSRTCRFLSRFRFSSSMLSHRHNTRVIPGSSSSSLRTRGVDSKCLSSRPSIRHTDSNIPNNSSSRCSSRNNSNSKVSSCRHSKLETRSSEPRDHRSSRLATHGHSRSHRNRNLHQP